MGLLIEATLLLGAARAAVLLFPYRRIMAALGQRLGETAVLNDAKRAAIGKVAWGIRVVSSRTPWKSNCLAQALAGQVMLARRGVGSTLHLGVAREQSGGLEAHAWLTVANVLVTGGAGHQRFTEVARFAR
jgi:hypothetical protein